MAIAHVGDVSSSTTYGANHVDLSLTYSSSSGNLLVLCYYTFYNHAGTPAGNIASVQDSRGNTWHYSTSNSASPSTSPPAIIFNSSGAGGYMACSIAWTFQDVGTVTSVSVTANATLKTNGFFFDAILGEFSGVAGVDTGATAQGNNSGNITGPSITLAQTGDGIMGIIGAANADPTGLPASWSAWANPLGHLSGYYIDAAGSGSYAPTWTVTSTAQDYVTAQVAFLNSSGTINGVTATAAAAAAAGSITYSSSVTGVVATATATAAAGQVAEGAVISGVVATAAAAAAAGSVVITVSIPGIVATAVAAAPAGGVSAVTPPSGVELYANQPFGTVSSGGTAALSEGQQETWTVSVTSFPGFPAANSGASPPTHFHVTDTATASVTEIIEVTNVSGSTWSVIRGAEGTIPVTHQPGFQITAVITAGSLSQLAVVGTGDITGPSTVPQVTGTHLASPLPVAQGGTGAASAAAAMTALAGSQVAGEYLRSDGANTYLQAIQAADVPTLNQNTTGTAGGLGSVTVSGGAQAGWVLTATSVSAADWQASAGGGATANWQFLPATYGTVHGDVKVVTDGAMTTGGSSTTLTCATSHPFTAGDVGKHFIVNGAAHASGLALVGTISGYTNSSTVTTSVGCSNTVTGAAVIWGTDDTATFQATINAAVAYMESTGYAQVYIPQPSGAGYMIAGSLVTSGYANSVLTIGPAPSVTAAQGTLDITGAAGQGILPFWLQVNPQIAGTVLVSPFLWASQGAQSANFSSFYDAAVLGAIPSNPALPPQVGGLVAFSSFNINVSNLTVMTPQTYQGTNLCGINLQGAAKGTFTKCAALFTANYNNSTAPNQMPSTSAMLGGLSMGLILPGDGNNARATMRDCSVMGYAFGTNLGECIVIDGSIIIACGCAFKYFGNEPTPGEHLAQVFGTQVQHCYKGVYVQGIGGGAGCQIDATMDVEVIQGGAGAMLSDSNSGAGLASLYGRLRVTGIYNVQILATPYPTNLEIISTNFGPGWVFSYGGFSTAGTTVAVQNPYFRPARVYWSGGTVSAVAAGVTIGGTGGSPTTAPSMTTVTTAAAGDIDWPSGGWLAFTFTGSPVWNVCRQ